MVMTRWWRLLSLILLLACAGGCGTTETLKGGTDCYSGGLEGSIVKATLRLEQHERNAPQITSDMRVEVPKKWRLARHLTFSENSPEYRQAMRCLLRGNEKSTERNEWHQKEPTVMETGDRVKVHYVAFTWISTEKHVLVGPWEVVPKGDKWTILLNPPTLRTIRWKNIEADLGGLNFNDRSERASYSSENTLSWRDQLPEIVRVEVDLSWRRTWAAVLSESRISTAGVVSWWVCASILLAVAALRTRRYDPATVRGAARRAPRGAAGGPGAQVVHTGAGRDLSLPRVLLEWAVLSVAVALSLLLLFPRNQESPRWHALLCIPAGLALIIVARPWSRGMSPAAPRTAPHEPARLSAARRRQVRAVVATAGAIAAVGLLVVVAHDLFGLPESLAPRRATTVGRAGLVVLGLATMWLWLAAMSAWAWRFAHEGGLLRARWTARWDRAPSKAVALVGCLLAAVAVALLACAWWVNKQQWKRATWLVDRPPASYGTSVNRVLENFSFTDLNWAFSYSWVLTGIALLALLHFRNQSRRAHRRHRPERFSLGPSRPDLLLTISMFAFFVGLRAARFAGASALYGIWLPLDILSVYLVLAVGRRRSVLGELGGRFRALRLDTEGRRRELMEKAHEYRNINHQMYLLEQGRGGGVTCAELEDQLRRLRGWLVAGCGRRNPPEQISVLDAALAWGPDGHWWSNAVRAARLAFCFGTLATAALVYYQARDLYTVDQTLYGPTGIPDAVANLILYQVAWAAAGFTLGALWRLLPGRRSQARAWYLTAAYCIPVLLATLFIRITDTNPRQLLLYTVLLLTVLTLTSIWMDLATFREERQYWPSPFALLVSIYQLRGLSGQIAWLLVQAAAVVAVWHNLRH
ncbi:DUF6185 family protein [Streptomyces puniciscabiei]|uniref:DUF6185 family protein n=1 Tax=Streptomyces puniciscabiei TaxID=164348 RepID=UPI0033332B74